MVLRKCDRLSIGFKCDRASVVFCGAIASWVGAIGRGISGDRTEKAVVGAIAPRLSVKIKKIFCFLTLIAK